MGRKPLSNIGDIHGNLTILNKHPNSGHIINYECKCKCGNTRTVPGYDLRKGKVSDCGKQCVLRGGNGVRGISKIGKYYVVEGKHNKYLGTYAQLQDAIQARKDYDNGLKPIKELNKRNTSGYKGVSWAKKRQKWVCYYKLKFLGYFDDINDAVATRQEAEKQ